MQRAILLLKASKKIRGSACSLSRKLFLGATCLFFCFALAFSLLLILSPDNELHTANLTYYFTWLVLVTTGYGSAMCVYSAFTKIKKEQSKNDFHTFASQLPVTQYDYMKAQYLDLLLCIFPGTFITLLTATLATLTHRLESFRLGLGIIIFYTIIIGLLQSIDKSLSMFINIHNSIKEGIYVFLAVLPIIAGSWLQKGYTYLYLINSRGQRTYTAADNILNGLNFLGGNIGIIVLILTFILGYYLCCLAPFQYYKMKGGRS